MAYQKSARAQIKADGDDGIVEALVATYDIDSIGDRIMPGAFAKTLDEWGELGDPIPFIWSHLHDDIDAYLGDVLEAKETDEGLYVKAQIDLEDPKSAKAYRLLKGGRVRNYSFAYDVRDSAPSDDDDNITELRELGLYEVGPTLIGMNRETRTLAVKQAGASSVEDAVLTLNATGTDGTFVMPTMRLKIGRVLSNSNEANLRQAHELIGGVLSKLDRQDDDEQQEQDDESKTSQPTEPEKRDERGSEKRDEPMQRGPDDDLAAHLSLVINEGE